MSDMLIDYKLVKTREELNRYRVIAYELGCDRLVIQNCPKQKSMNYEVSIWLDENNEICGANFHTKKEALDYAKRNLKKNPTAVADFKHWNNKGDDYDYTYYRLKDGELTEVHDF